MLVRLNSPEARVARLCRESVFTPEYKIHETLQSVQSMLLCHECISASVPKDAPHEEIGEECDVRHPRIVIVLRDGYAMGMRSGGITA